jgi:hypothetical protein
VTLCSQPEQDLRNVQLIRFSCFLCHILGESSSVAKSLDRTTVQKAVYQDKTSILFSVCIAFYVLLISLPIDLSIVNFDSSQGCGFFQLCLLEVLGTICT